MPCRINRRRIWAGRLLLESQTHDEQCFLTLTYDDANLPIDNSLSIRDYQLFLKKVRKFRKVSYYLVGEYGRRTLRPHYHVVLFGIQPERMPYVIRDKTRKLYPVEKVLFDAWSKGQVHVGNCNEKSLAYCCKHLTKGLKNEIRYDEFQQPEFARMSLNPAIGKRAIADFGEWLTSERGSAVIAEIGDVPKSFRHCRTEYSFGRYLTQQLRKSAGFHETTTPASMINYYIGEAIKRWDGKSIQQQRAIRDAHGKKARMQKSFQDTKL